MITLAYANLTATTAAHSRVLVAFCAEFSPHCLALRGELAEAAVALRGAAVLLALVDSKFEDEDRRQPIATLSWYEDGTAHPYTGGRVAQSITQWVWSRLNASGAAREGRLEATGVKKDELRRLAASSAAPFRPMQSPLGKLRSDMMKWYCVGGQHDDIPPCKTFSFMTKMRATSSAEEKKKLLTARQEVMKNLSPEERKKRSFAFWSGYSAMYKEYCETTDIPEKNPDVCASPLLKSLYGRRRAGGESGGSGGGGEGRRRHGAERAPNPAAAWIPGLG